jgi:hypothetical protein
MRTTLSTAPAPASARIDAAPDPVSTLEGVARELFNIRLSAEEKTRWADAARAQGLSLSEYVRRAEEGYALSNVLELQVEDERRRREARQRAAELEPEPEPEVAPARERSRRPGPRARPRRTIGDALREADANAGFTRAAR